MKSLNAQEIINNKRKEILIDQRREGLTKWRQNGLNFRNSETRL